MLSLGSGELSISISCSLSPRTVLSSLSGPPLSLVVFGGGTTTVISSSPSLDVLRLLASSPVISVSSLLGAPLTEPLARGFSVLRSLLPLFVVDGVLLVDDEVLRVCDDLSLEPDLDESALDFSEEVESLPDLVVLRCSGMFR